ncbi:MAG: cytochrome c [Thermodesulfovibrionales bacterium]|nr:cytochrome c [Thermodesulfovibrionales bacterium]
MQKTRHVVIAALTLALILAVAAIAYSQKGDPKKGKRIYDAYCVPCHGETGAGDGTRGMIEQFDPMPRNHTEGKYMNKRPDDELFDVIKEGGKSRNFSHIMPPWKTIISDEEVWDVFSYVRSLAVPSYKPGMAEEKKGR